MSGRVSVFHAAFGGVGWSGHCEEATGTPCVPPLSTHKWPEPSPSSVFLFYVIARLWCHGIIAPFRTQKGPLGALRRWRSLHGDNLCYATQQNNCLLCTLEGLLRGDAAHLGSRVTVIERQRWCSKRRKIYFFTPPSHVEGYKGKNYSRYSKAFSSTRALKAEKREEREEQPRFDSPGVWR